MKKTRCKFRCQSVTDHGFSKEVKFTAHYDPNLPADQSFSQATPAGDLRIVVTNPAANEMFKPQRDYFLDITLVEEEKETA